MALTKTEVSELYVAIFNRASEGSGNQNWQNQGLSMSETATLMLGTGAAKAYFGNSLDTNQAFIEHIYLNTLNKTAADDPDGIANWVAQLDSRAMTKGEVVAAMIEAINTYAPDGEKYDANDAKTVEAYNQFANRVAVSDYMADTVENPPADYETSTAFDKGLPVTADTTTVSAADALIDSMASGANADVATLTYDPDTLTANVFNAGRVWNPDGSDQMNSLNDDDNLTGTGTNPTLNVTIVNDTESGDLNIMPTLNGIETVNAAFTADTAQTIDLQDASNIVNLNATKIDDLANQAVTFDNIQSVLKTASVTNSNDNTNADIIFDHNAVVLNGTTDEVALSLSNVQMDNLRIDGGTEGYETINLNSSGDANTLNTLTAESLQTLNITGDQSLRLGGTANTMDAVTGTLDEGDTYLAGLNNVAGSLTKVDASALSAALTYHIGAEINAAEDGTGANIELEIIGSASDDTFVLTNGNNIDAAAGNTDTINGGEGNDTLVITGGAAETIATPADGNPNLTAIENLEIRTGQDATAVADVVTVDADAFDSALASIYVRNEGQVAAIAPTVAPNTTSAAELMTVNLDDLSADLASGGNITIASGTSGNNGMANNVLNLNLKDASGSADTAAINIATGVNNTAGNSRFNFELSVDGDDSSRTPSEDAGAVESLTLNDNDSESNTVRLVNVAEEIGTITLTGGTAGTFMNLDETVGATAVSNGGLYQYDTTGNNTPTATVGTQAVTADGQQVADRSAATQAHIVAATFDASAYEGDVVARFSTAQDANGVATSTGGQTITTGSGNDTIIFDNLADNRAGLTISDKVDGGAGTDTIVIDGALTTAATSSAIALSASEWTNVSNFENIRLMNAGNAIDATANTYAITITDDMITNNHGTDGLLNIINDNDALNDIVGNADSAIGTVTSESAVVIDASSLSSSKHFSYNGEEGATATNDRIIVSDANMNGQNIIDGGALDNLGTTNGNVPDVVNAVTVGNTNGDVLEIQNAAVVTVGDLENVKNIGTLEFTTDKSTTQVSRLQLNDGTVDMLVDSYHTSLSRGGANATTAGSSERLQVNALDSTAIASVATATTGLTLEAGVLTDKSDLDVLLGRGTNNVTTGAGNDQVVLLGNYVAGTYAVNENGVALDDYSTASAAARVVTDTIDLGTGTDTLTTYGAINLTGATLTGVENMVANSAVVMTADQLAGLTSLTFEGTGAHQLTITAGTGIAVNLANVHLDAGSLVYDTTAVAAGAVTGAVVVAAGAASALAGTVGTTPTNNVVDIPMTSGDDNINVAGSGAVTIAFADSAANNGVDTISGLSSNDTLDFSAFLGAGKTITSTTTGLSLYNADSSTNVDINGDIALFNNQGTALTASTLGDEFDSANAFSIASGGKAVVIDGNVVAGVDTAQVWYIEDANNNAAIDDGEIVLVGNLTDADSTGADTSLLTIV